jgi:hypothetical protein
MPSPHTLPVSRPALAAALVSLALAAASPAAGAARVPLATSAGVACAPGGSAPEDEAAETLQEMIEASVAYLHRHESSGVTMDPRAALDRAEAIRLGVVTQLLGFNSLQRRHPTPVTLRDVRERADFLVTNRDAIMSRSAFDGMLGYALLGAFEVTGDSTYLESARPIVERARDLEGALNTLNWGLMSAMCLGKYYALTGDTLCRDRGRLIVYLLPVFQNADGSFPHFCWTSEDVHYTAWMTMELVLARRWIRSDPLDHQLAGTRRFLESCVDSGGVTTYMAPCSFCPGGTRRAWSAGSGCIEDYETRGWVNEMGYLALCFGTDDSPRFLPVLRRLRSFQSHGGFPDKWDWFPGPEDPLYPWASPDPSVIRTSLVFWSLAELAEERSLRAGEPVASGHGRESLGERRDAPQPAPAAVSSTAVPGTAELLAAIVAGREFGAPRPPDDEVQHVPPGPPIRTLDGGAARVADAVGLLRLSPNPVRGGCTIRFRLAADGEASLVVLDVAGRPVRRLVRERLAAGEHHATWDGTDSAGRAAPPGLYFVRLEQPGGTVTSRLAVIR